MTGDYIGSQSFKYNLFEDSNDSIMSHRGRTEVWYKVLGRRKKKQCPNSHFFFLNIPSFNNKQQLAFFSFSLIYK